MKHITIHSSKKIEYQLTTYNQEGKYYVLHDNLGKIAIVDSEGEIKSFKNIDK